MSMCEPGCTAPCRNLKDYRSRTSLKVMRVILQYGIYRYVSCG